MKVTLRFVLDDPSTVRRRRWARHIEWPPDLPLPFPGMVVVPAEGLGARKADQVIYAPEGPGVIVDFEVDAMVYDVEGQAEALARAGFREIDLGPAPG